MPADLPIATRESHSVKEFVEEVFAYAGVDWQEYVEVDPRYFRPTEVDFLRADASKAREKLGWDPEVSFKELIAIMVDADMETMGLRPIGQGQCILSSKFSSWHQWSSAATPLYENARRKFE